MTNQRGQLLQEHMHVKWITAPDQHADCAGQTLLTRDRAVIRAWAEVRHAEPATGVGTVDIRDGGAAIRFAFPGVGRLRPISWDDWFQNFNEYNLVFAFEEETDARLPSHNYRLVRADDLPQYDAAGPPAVGETHAVNVAEASPRRRSEERPPAGRSTAWRRFLRFIGAHGARG